MKPLYITHTFTTFLSFIFLLIIGCGNKPTETTEPPEFTQADLVKGGAMYDNWWVIAGISEPRNNHPLWSQRPDPATNIRTGSVTHRCKECHGWDYKGVNGAYSSGSHRTGFPGISTTKSPQEIFDLLKDHHQFGSLGLNDTALWDITKFVLEGVVDMDQFIDQTGRFSGSSASGRAPYTQWCESCHGADGLTKPYDAIPGQPGASPDYDDFPQKIANENPWEFLHKVRFGQPGTDMPLLAKENITLSDLKNLGAYSQSLPSQE